MIFNSLSLHEYLWWKNIFNQKKVISEISKITYCTKKIFYSKSVSSSRKRKRNFASHSNERREKFLTRLFPSLLPSWKHLKTLWYLFDTLQFFLSLTEHISLSSLLTLWNIFLAHTLFISIQVSSCNGEEETKTLYLCWIINTWKWSFKIMIKEKVLRDKMGKWQ